MIFSIVLECTERVGNGKFKNLLPLKELLLEISEQGPRLVFLVAKPFTSIKTNFVLVVINIILIGLLVSLVYFAAIC